MLVNEPVAVTTVGNAVSGTFDGAYRPASCSMDDKFAASRCLLALTSCDTPVIVASSVAMLAFESKPVVASAVAGSVKP